MADKPSDVHPLTARFLGREMYLCITRPVRGPGITDEKLTEHLQHQIKLEKDGIMFAAGPLYSRENDKPEAGMFVIRAGSFEEAELIVKQDPLHVAGLRKYTLQKWRINEGSYTVTVNYSDQTVKVG